MTTKMDKKMFTVIIEQGEDDYLLGTVLEIGGVIHRVEAWMSLWRTLRMLPLGVRG